MSVVMSPQEAFKLFTKAIRRKGLTLSQAQILCSIGHGKKSAPQIADEIGLRESSLFSPLISLQNFGEVEKAGACEVKGDNHRYASLYKLTDKGMMLYQEIFG